MIETRIECPPENELIDYLLGKLPDDLLSLLESHFEDCAICEQTMRGLSATDTLSQIVFSQISGPTNAVDGPQPADLQFVSGLIQKLQLTTIDRRHDRAALQERAIEVIQMLDDAEQSDSLGRLGEYRIEELIGAGSTGVVFRAHDMQLDRCVALKVLRPSLGDAARQRFMAEARAAASIEHPNVITIYHVGQHNSLAFIAMQWLPGETLEDRLARVTFLPEGQVRDIAVQIATGLQAAHHKTLIHRDIKPANIWLCEASDQAIILDFGLARIADDDPHMTSTGMLAGTPNFMSPEQTRGQELDGRSDLFSLGCLMYRAATGKLPFGAGGVLATLQSIQHHQPSVPSELNPNISSEFSDLVMCLLEKQQANRPNCATDLIYALGHPRESWPFAATRYRSQPAPRIADPESQTNTRSGVGRWIAAATLMALLAAGWFAFGQQIIRIATNQGEIVIETDDDNVQVEILSSGEVVRVIDTSTQQRIDIKAGEYQITARDPNNANGEFKISNNRIVLTRGGRQIVSVDLIEKRSTESTGNPTVNHRIDPRLLDTTPEPMFEGRTFEDWRLELSRERSKSAVKTGLMALGELSRGDSRKQELAINAVTPLIRIHGNTDNRDGWPDFFNEFLSYLPPERVIQFGIDEIQHGTSQSRSQLRWLFLIGSIYEGQNKAQANHRSAMRENLNRIIDAGCDHIEQKPTDADNELIRTLMSTAIESSFSTDSDAGQTVYEQAVENNIPHLVKRLTTSTNVETREFLATTLVSTYANYLAIVSNAFFNMLGDPNLSSELTGIIYFKHLTTTSEIASYQTIPSLIRIFESDVLCDRVLDYLEINQTTVVQHRSGDNGRGGGRVGDVGGIGGLGGAGGGYGVRDAADLLNSDPKRTSTPGSDSRFPAGQNAIRADLLFAIGNKLGYAAKRQAWLDEEAASDSPQKHQLAIEAANNREITSNALPWLDKIASSDSPLKQHVANAAKKARGEDLQPANSPETEEKDND